MTESTTFHAGCKILASVLVCISSLFAVSAFATVFDYSNSGVVRASSGNYYLVEGSNVTAISAEKALSMQHKFPVNTSRGAQEVTFVRQATPYVSKIGSAVTTLAKKVGPLGMAISAADLVCSLSNICNQAGQWLMSSPYADDAMYPSTTDYSYWFVSSPSYAAPTAAAACSVYGSSNPYGYRTEYVSESLCRIYNGSTLINNAIPGHLTGSCAPNYLYDGSKCVFQLSKTSSAPTDADWTNAESKLNDPRFVDELVSQKQPVPVNIPTIVNSPLRQPISEVTEPEFDSTGTQTGTRTKRRELVIDDLATADKPNQIGLKEEETTTRYDQTGQQVGTPSKTTTEVTQSTPQPQSQLCGLLGQEPCNVKVDERGVDTAIAGLNPLGQAATTSVTGVFDSVNNSILTRSGGVGSGFEWPWIVNGGSCSPLVVDAQKGLVFDICPHIPLVHNILGYVFYVLTAISIFNVFFQPKTT